MKERELNRKLIATFPEMEQAYYEHTEWQEGDDTGSHVVYGDVLVPTMLTLIKGDCYPQAQKYFDYLEALLEESDEYSTNVVAVSVIESIVTDEVDSKKVKSLLGEKTLAIWEEFEEWISERDT
ncbi:MAG: hypothetical protein FWE41_04885 [Coriobacteriia bacterium]|nr:hypothetical protein [Coriobacteriia bacterium]